MSFGMWILLIVVLWAGILIGYTVCQWEYQDVIEKAWEDGEDKPDGE